jgi:dipeptidyl aminopeptidase/acylaminoacyl peptidase
MTFLSAESGYKMPPENIVKIFDTPRTPYFTFIPFSQIAFEKSYIQYKNLEDISKPVLKLAGVEFSPQLNAPPDDYPINLLNIHDLKKRTVVKTNFPKNIKIRQTRLSIDEQKLAVSYETNDGIKLMIINISNGEISYIEDIKINDIVEDTGFFWLNDNKTLIIKTVPENRKEVVTSAIPEFPIIEETYGKKSTTRTYRNLLKNKNDEKLFEYYFKSQLVTLNIETKLISKIGKPALFDDVSISPNNNFLLIQKIVKPYSYLVPYYYFPKQIQIIDMKGNLVNDFYQRPLLDEIPIGGTFLGPRNIHWQPLKKSSLVWVEALDEGNPKNKVKFRDRILRLEIPSIKNTEELFKTEQRFSGINWSEEEDILIYSEYDRDKLWKKVWFYNINTDEKKLIQDLSIKDKYNFPGELIKKKTKNGKIVFAQNGDNIYYINNKGATPEGNFPFLSKYNLKKAVTEILFKSKTDFHEIIYGFIDQSFDEIAISKQNKVTPPNYYLFNLETKKKTKYSDYKNPHPEISNLKRELVTYKRADGTLLSGELYLPADYKNGQRLPLVISAYPREYTGNSTAGQIDFTSNQFNRFWGAAVRYFALDGYAVLNKASIPIVGNPETVNENFIEQTVSSVKAAIDYLDERKIIDREQVGIIGHSYGAFMVANVLAHSDLCAAGIARSGAYNRTLTPFGFQRERRTLWEAKDFYIKVSPFMYAEKIDVPLLLIHGENDPNSGTYPMQSQRFYQALKGNGATARLVILPFEGHAYQSEEANLHVLTEMIVWFEKYVKNKR